MRESTSIWFLAVVTTALGAGCGVPGAAGGVGRADDAGRTDDATPDDAPAPPGMGTITLLHYNDLHAHLTPHTDLVPDAAPGATASATRIVTRGGIARLATLVRRIRGEAPDSLLMNIGDTYHGGVEALFTNGNAVAAPVNALGIDIGVPGNWDFAYGPMVTRARYAAAARGRPGLMRDGGVFAERDGGLLAGRDGGARPGTSSEVLGPNFPNLAANVTDVTTGEPFLPPTRMMEVGGVRVGFVGITSDIVPRMHPILALGLEFLEGEAAYVDLVERHASELRARGAHVVVVMSELGIQKDFRLADVIEPGTVDVFFSAHTHEATFEPLVSASGAYVVEAGNDGYLGRMDVTVIDGRVVERSWQLLPIDASIPEDPAMRALVDEARRPFLGPDVHVELAQPFGTLVLDQSIDTVVGTTPHPLDRRHALENRFNDAFTDMLRRRAGTEVAMAPGFRFDAVIAEPGTTLEDDVVATGAITLEDVYRFFPVVYTLGTANVTGDRLRSLVEEALASIFSPNEFAQSGGWFEGFAGLRLRVDLAAPEGSRVLAMALDDGSATGRPIVPSDSIRIAGCRRPFDEDDVLCSYGGFTDVMDFVGTSGRPLTAIDLFISELGAVPPPRDSIEDTSGTTFWPEGVFVQPLRGVE